MGQLLRIFRGIMRESYLSKIIPTCELMTRRRQHVNKDMTTAVVVDLPVQDANGNDNDLEEFLLKISPWFLFPENKLGMNCVLSSP